MSNEQGEGYPYEEAAGRNSVPSEEIRGVLGKDEEGFGRFLAKAARSGSFMDAILDLWGKLDGLRLSGRPEAAAPLGTWAPRLLRREYTAWFDLNPEDAGAELAGELAEVRESVLSAIRTTAKDRGIYFQVVEGINLNAESASEVEEYSEREVQSENEEVGSFFGAVIRELDSSEKPTRERLLELQAECRALQDRYNLKKRFRREDLESYTKADLALLKIEEYVQRELPTARSEVARRPVQINLQAQRDQVIADARRMQAERQVHLARMQQQGGRDDTFVPQRRDAGEFAERLIEQGFNPVDVPELANLIAQSPYRSSYGAGEAQTVPTYPKREFEKRRGEKSYGEMKKILMASNDWSKYGWTQADIRDIERMAGESGLSTAGLKNIMAAALLHGETAKGFQGVLISRQNLITYLDGLGISVHDEDALGALMPSGEARRSHLDNYFFQRDPEYIEDLAWQIAFETPEMFGENGVYPVLEKTVFYNPHNNGGKFEIKERVNPANVVMWMRYVEIQLHGNHTQRAEMDFEQDGGVKKTLKKLNIYEMIELKARIGRSKYGVDYTPLIEKFEQEAVDAGLPRSGYLDIWHVKGSAEDMNKTRIKYAFENNYTRTFWGQTAAAFHLKMSEAYNIDPSVHPDGKVGAVSNTIFMAYSHLLNPAEMARVLNLGTRAEDLGKIFNLNNLRERRNSLAEGAGFKPENWLNLESPNSVINGVRLGDVFDFNTKMPRLTTHEEQYNFIKLITFYSHVSPEGNAAKLIRDTIATQAVKLHGLATTKNGVSIPYNKDLAEWTAFWSTWYLGVAPKLAVFAESHQWESQVTGMFRWQQAGGRPRGGKPSQGFGGNSGNLWTIDDFRRMLVSPVDAWRTASPAGSKSIYQVFDEAQKLRLKIDREIAAKVDVYMRDKAKNRVETRIAKIIRSQDERILSGAIDATAAKSAAKIREIAEQEIRLEVWDKLLDQNKEKLKEYREKAEELIFKEDTERRWHQEHYERIVKLDKRIRQGDELKLDKYIKYTPLVGASFAPEDFHKDMSQFITDVRFAYKEFGTEIDFSEMIWDWDPVIERMRRMPRGESMFGEWVKDIPAFKDVNGDFSWKMVNTDEGRIALYKGVVERYLIGQLRQYRELNRWSANPRWSFITTEDILEAIAKIPGIVEIGGGNVSVSGFFFDKATMERIREASKTQKYGMYLRETLSKGFGGNPGQKDGILSGLLDALGIVAKASLDLAA